MTIYIEPRHESVVVSIGPIGRQNRALPLNSFIISVDGGFVGAPPFVLARPPDRIGNAGFGRLPNVQTKLPRLIDIFGIY